MKLKGVLYTFPFRIVGRFLEVLPREFLPVKDFTSGQFDIEFHVVPVMFSGHEVRNVSVVLGDRGIVGIEQGY